MGDRVQPIDRVGNGIEMSQDIAKVLGQVTRGTIDSARGILNTLLHVPELWARRNDASRVGGFRKGASRHVQRLEYGFIDVSFVGTIRYSRENETEQLEREIRVGRFLVGREKRRELVDLLEQI
jgi:hypothetical protein